MTPRDDQKPPLQAERTVRGITPSVTLARDFLDDPAAPGAAPAGHAAAFSVTYSELVALHLSARGWPDAQIAGILGVPAAAVAALVDSVDERLAEAYDTHRSAPGGGRLT